MHIVTAGIMELWTHNGVEALNKVLKYGYLPKKNSLTLSGIATLLVKNYLPDMYQKFKITNCLESIELTVKVYLHIYVDAHTPSLPTAYTGKLRLTSTLQKMSLKSMMVFFKLQSPKVEITRLLSVVTVVHQAVLARTGSDIIYLASTFSACLIFTLIIGIGLHFLNVT